MLYKHVLGRKRIFIYTQPPVELACMLCQVAADICFEDQTALDSVEGATVPRPCLMGKQKEGINVLGVVTLHNIGRLERESETRHDLVIDTTSVSPEWASRPGLQLSVRESNSRLRRPSYRPSTIRFTWSDVKLVRSQLQSPADLYDNECVAST